MDLSEAFRKAEFAYRQGQLETAAQLLEALRRAAPTYSEIWHLSALVRKAEGHIAAAIAFYEKAASLSPGNAEIFANMANCRAQINDQKAIPNYDAAIALAPDRHDFRLNRAITHLQFGHPAAALIDIEYLEQFLASEARYWSVAGQTYQAIDAIEKAKACFRNALKFDPDRLVPITLLGTILLHEGEADAVSLLGRACEISPHDRNIVVAHAEALEAHGKYDAARSVLQNALANNPDWLDGYVIFGRLCSEMGEPENAISIYRNALTQQPDNIALWSNFAAYQRQRDQLESALEIVEEATASHGHMPDLCLLGASLLDDMGRSQDASEYLVHVPAAYPGASTVRIRHSLCSKRYDEAARIAESEIARASSDIGIWSLVSLCWRLTGDARESWLNPSPPLFGQLDIGLPECSEDIADYLRSLHFAADHPVGQSMRHGTQTRGSLFARTNIAARALRDHLGKAIDEYWQNLPPLDESHPLLRHRNALPQFAGSWSVRLTGKGFHVAHVHPAGVLSSAFYISLPESFAGGEKAGWLEIGSAPPELVTGLEPYAMIEPKIGRLAIFPSYLFHGTRPFEAGERMTVAFDVRV